MPVPTIRDANDLFASPRRSKRFIVDGRNRTRNNHLARFFFNILFYHNPRSLRACPETYKNLDLICQGIPEGLRIQCL
jgi:hypothetical protein